MSIDFIQDNGSKLYSSLMAISFIQALRLLEMLMDKLNVRRNALCDNVITKVEQVASVINGVQYHKNDTKEAHSARGVCRRFYINRSARNATFSNRNFVKLSVEISRVIRHQKGSAVVHRFG